MYLIMIKDPYSFRFGFSEARSFVFPESFSEAGFSFRFRGPGVGARPRDAEPRPDFFLCAGCGVHACRSAPVQARVGPRDFSLVKLVCF